MALGSFYLRLGVPEARLGHSIEAMPSARPALPLPVDLDRSLIEYHEERSVLFSERTFTRLQQFHNRG